MQQQQQQHTQIVLIDAQQTSKLHICLIICGERDVAPW